MEPTIRTPFELGALTLSSFRALPFLTRVYLVNVEHREEAVILDNSGRYLTYKSGEPTQRIFPNTPGKKPVPLIPLAHFSEPKLLGSTDDMVGYSQIDYTSSEWSMGGDNTTGNMLFSEEKVAINAGFYVSQALGYRFFM